ncbi:alpha/beta hydrolase family protein [Paractinoplanes atraurantiacus]|uniref:Prolyl oligopeptidase family protein n=1 Tax=Paractinoplanes atraurantiacus TaxID=1036182 RepID=A0A285JR39_9ACTN|nr:prolyl oligopeptidase family serine peptidase [Actinoplanes atraurantiacus]SNY62247.1 Prolyl oligopeptidase family protein [Actinoplanes atraurantiacus]
MVGYHLLDAPRTPAAFAAALPLDGLDAWKIYLRLPLPTSEPDELWRLFMDDAVLNVYRHVVDGALAEFPSALVSIRRENGIADDVPLALMGGSLGGAAAQLVMAESGFAAHAAVLVNPVVRLRDSINGLSVIHDNPYTWGDASSAVASRVDFVARSKDISDAAIRFITGADDMQDVILKPVAAAVEALTSAGGIVDWKVVPDMAHALAPEPGTEPAPQTPHAAVVDKLAVEWFNRYLF